MLTLAKTMQADHRSIVFTLPASICLDPMIDEWSLGAFRRNEASLGMVRFVNAEAALKAASYRGNARLTLEILDSQIAENNAHFTVCFEEGKALSVRRDAGEKAAIHMDISEFSRFLIGAADVSALAFIRRVYGYSREDLELLGHIFYHKPCFLTEYF